MMASNSSELEKAAKDKEIDHRRHCSEVREVDARIVVCETRNSRCV